MASAMQWQSLLGLPLADAQARLRAAGADFQVQQSCAQRREPVRAATPRVIRVCSEGACVRLTVSDFRDGDPDK